MKVKFWGVRGSIPVPGKNTVKYGGNTPCISVGNNSNELIIFDAGTGIFNLGNEIINEKKYNSLHIFLTHFHWDHIQGFPFFAPFFSSEFQIKIYYNSVEGLTAAKAIDEQMKSGFFPVKREEVFKANIEFVDISSVDEVNIDIFKIRKIHTHHSEGTYSYRVDEDEKSLVYMTDNEIFCKREELHPNLESICELNADLINFTNNADILIHDTQYFEEHFSEKVGWGHSNNSAVVYFAHKANVKKLFLFHYDPGFNDKRVEELLTESVGIAKNELNSKTEILLSREGVETEF